MFNAVSPLRFPSKLVRHYIVEKLLHHKSFLNVYISSSQWFTGIKMIHVLVDVYVYIPLRIDILPRIARDIDKAGLRFAPPKSTKVHTTVVTIKPMPKDTCYQYTSC